MSKRNWIIISALGLALPLVVVAYGQQAETDDPASQARSGYGQPQGPLAPTPLFIIESEAEASARRRSEEQAQQRELDDLAAQKGMDEAAQRMANYSLYQTVLVFFGTVALVWTLILTRRTAIAAEGAVSVTREMGQTQMRAYVSIVAIEFTEKPGTNDLVTIRVRLKNTGQTPAYRVHSEHCVGVVVNTERSGNDVLERPLKGHRPSLDIIAPGDAPFTITRVRDKLRPFDMNIHDALMADKIEIYGWGWTTYVDVFGCKHETTFQWFADKASIESGIGFRPDSVGNTAN